VSGAVVTAPPPTDPDALQLVALRPAHLDEVLLLERRVATPGWSRAVFERELASPDDRRYLAALVPSAGGSTVAGFGGVQVLTDEAHVTTLTVDPARRRQGIASRLLVALLRAARGLGATSATLEVRAGNRPAQRLYAGFGFRPVGIRPAYYDGEDALIMWAHDVDGDAFAELLAERERRLDGRAGKGRGPAGPGADGLEREG
jgi:ribosomal-protein-alanine N-acetyltransferase